MQPAGHCEQHYRHLCYALFFVGRRSSLRRWLLVGFGCVIAANVAALAVFYL